MPRPTAFGRLTASLALAALGGCSVLRDRADEHEKTALMYAAEAGDAAKVRQLLDDHARPNQRVRGYSTARELLAFMAWMQELPDRDPGYTALHYAARTGGYQRLQRLARGVGGDDLARYGEVARLLLEGGAEPSITARGGETPLSLAATSGDTAFVRIFLAHGAPVKRPAKLDPGAQWISPLVTAAMARSEPVARVLLDAGADPNPDGIRPIATAAAQGDEALVALLLARRAEPDPVDREGLTPLMTAARAGHLGIVRRLLTAGADAARRDARAGWTAAQWAANGGHDDVARLLAQADPDAAGEQEIQLVRAVETGDSARVRALLAAGAKPNTRVATGSMLISVAVYREDVVIARLLLDAGALTNHLVSGEIPLLQRAAQVGNVELVRLLLEHGAAAGLPQTATYAASSGRLEVLQLVERTGANLREDADQPLRSAAVAGCVECVRYLLGRGAQADARDSNQRTALGQAVAFRRHDAVRALLEGGADARQADPESGWTPLMNAAMAGDSAMIGILIGAGADPAARDKQGKTAADYARGAGNAQVVPLLARRGSE